MGINQRASKIGWVQLGLCLTNLFDGIYSVNFASLGLRKGLIYTLFKGCRKYDNDSKNYREISLLPVITKLMERLLLNRI